MKKILLSLAILTISASILCLPNPLSVLEGANKSIRPFSKFVQDPITKSFTVTQLDDNSISKIVLISKKGDFIKIWVYYKNKKRKPMPFDIQAIKNKSKGNKFLEDMTKNITSIINKTESFYKLQKPIGEQTGAFTLGQFKSMKKHPKVSEAESFIIEIYNKKEKLQSNYNNDKITYEEAMIQVNKLNKEEEKYNKIIKKYKKATTKIETPKEKISDQRYKKALQEAKNIKL